MYLGKSIQYALYLYSDFLRTRYSALSIRYCGTIANVIGVLMIDLINKTKQKNIPNAFLRRISVTGSPQHTQPPQRPRPIKSSIKNVVLSDYWSSTTKLLSYQAII